MRTWPEGLTWEANPQHLPIAATTIGQPVANRTAWSGGQIGAQAGSTLTLALPAPTSADLGSVPTVSAPGLPAPVVALLPDGNTTVSLPIPAAASGAFTLSAGWPGGQHGNIQLSIGATVTRAGNLGQPDDLVVAPDGSVLYTDLATNTVGQILADGTHRTLITGLNVPEGLAVTGPSTALLADQGTDRVLQWTAPNGLRVLRQLTLVPGVAGIDGLGVAVIGGQPTALLPDSAAGRLLLLPLSTLTATVFPGHWQRPTDAVVSAGQLYLVDEYGGRLWRGPLQGPLQPIGPSMVLPDDVAVDANGVAFVNTLGSGATPGRLERVTPSGQASVVLSGLNDPQGVGLDGGGNVLVAEAGAGRVAVDIRSCLPRMLGSARLNLTVGGSAQTLPLGADCRAGQPGFTLAPGARWPEAGTTWAMSGTQALTLSNGARASLDASAGGVLLFVQPPARGAGGVATLAVLLHVGQQVIPQQILVHVVP